MKIRFFFIFFIQVLFFNQFSFSLPKDFVYLSDIDPTILSDLRYNSDFNFTNHKIPGYHSSVLIMTRQSALALKCAQKKLNKDNYSIVVYDAYRPQQAVNYFMEWSKDIEEQAKKAWFYPRVDKAKVFELGYVAEKSGHSRGSTVDLTIIRKDEVLKSVQAEPRTLKDGSKITYLNDGTVDMGSSFDLFDEASHYKNKLITKSQQKKRIYLKKVMESCGFNNYKEEWWHFTLKNEPFPDTYFDFPIE